MDYKMIVIFLSNVNRWNALPFSLFWWWLAIIIATPLRIVKRCFSENKVVFNFFIFILFELFIYLREERAILTDPFPDDFLIVSDDEDDLPTDDDLLWTVLLDLCWEEKDLLPDDFLSNKELFINVDKKIFIKE